MDSIKHLVAYVTNKPTNIEIDGEGTDYMDEDPMVLVLREEGTCWELPVIVKATTELKNWSWEGAAHPMEDSAMKMKTIEPITPTKKIKTIKLITLAKNIVSIPIESIPTSIIVPIESICDCIPIESISVESIEFVENFFFPSNEISNSAYLLALHVFISEIGKETLNNKELKQGHVECIKEET